MATVTKALTHPLIEVQSDLANPPRIGVVVERGPATVARLLGRAAARPVIDGDTYQNVERATFRSGQPLEVPLLS